MWKILGKEGLAVRAPWPVAGVEDKILTRQAKFLRDTMKNFRAQTGKAKKGWKKASVLVTDSYPQWKIETLLWMQKQFSYEGGFAKTFMGDLKTWATTSVEDKKLVKFTMQFASFVKGEVEDVGSMAMDIQLPFDQKAILAGSEKYIKTQLNLEELDFVKLDEAGDSAAAEVPERVSENVTPGKPYLWLR